MDFRNKKGQFVKGHLVGKGNKYRLGISPWNKGKKKTKSNNLKGGRPFGAKDKKKRKTDKYSESKRGKKNPWFGKHSPVWKGGITTEYKKARASFENEIWRKAVFERDNFCCQKCVGKGILNAHHIKNFAQFPELRFAIDNGITLCESCHKLFHRVYGLKNNTREQLLQFLK